MADRLEDIIGAAAIVLGILRDENRGQPLLTAVLTVALLIFWAPEIDAGGETQDRFLWTVAAFGALYAIGGWVGIWTAAMPSWWSALSAGSATGFFVIAYLGLEWWGGELDWGPVAASLAVIMILASLPVLLVAPATILAPTGANGSDVRIGASQRARTDTALPGQVAG